MLSAQLCRHLVRVHGLLLMAWAFGRPRLSGLHMLTNLIALVLFLPSIAVASRRLHDTGRSGWNQLWMLTIIGIIPVLIWLASESNDHGNKFSNKPLSKHKVHLADNKSTEIINANVTYIERVLPRRKLIYICHSRPEKRQNFLSQRRKPFNHMIRLLFCSNFKAVNAI